MRLRSGCSRCANLLTALYLAKYDRVSELVYVKRKEAKKDERRGRDKGSILWAGIAGLLYDMQDYSMTER